MRPRRAFTNREGLFVLVTLWRLSKGKTFLEVIGLSLLVGRTN